MVLVLSAECIRSCVHLSMNRYSDHMRAIRTVLIVLVTDTCKSPLLFCLFIEWVQLPWRPDLEVNQL